MSALSSVSTPMERIRSPMLLIAIIACFSWTQPVFAFQAVIPIGRGNDSVTAVKLRSTPSHNDHCLEDGSDGRSALSRRGVLNKIAYAASLGVSLSTTGMSAPALAASVEEPSRQASLPTITDKFYIDVKTPTSSAPQRLVIGLFGEVAPRSTKQLLQLASKSGLPVPCKPKDSSRMLQKEQLEANKVYKNCVETEDTGVTYEYGTIWRIIQDERIDVGAVAGKFIARQYPTWGEATPPPKELTLRHDRLGLVSVQVGDESGFGFTIHPSNKPSPTLDATHLVIGTVLDESMPIVQEWNNLPVVTSSKINYMGLTGGPTTKSAPTRACAYGGPMYCNENKPLAKLSIMGSGVL